MSCRGNPVCLTVSRAAFAVNRKLVATVQTSMAAARCCCSMRLKSSSSGSASRRAAASRRSTQTAWTKTSSAASRPLEPALADAANGLDPCLGLLGRQTPGRHGVSGGGRPWVGVVDGSVAVHRRFLSDWLLEKPTIQRIRQHRFTQMQAAILVDR